MTTKRVQVHDRWDTEEKYPPYGIPKSLKSLQTSRIFLNVKVFPTTESIVKDLYQNISISMNESQIRSRAI